MISEVGTSGYVADSWRYAGAELRQLAAGTRLSPTSRRILARLLEHPDELAWLSAKALAERVGVSQPSVSRLAASLGFDGYAALRDHLRQTRLGSAPCSTDKLAASHVDVVASQEAANTAEVSMIVEGWAELPSLAEAAVQSAPLVVAGVRASAYLAQYFAYLAAKVHPNVMAVTSGGSIAVDALVGARSSGAEVLVAVCMPRYPSEAIEVIEGACRLGLRVALISDQAMPQLRNVEPEWHLALPVGSALTFDAHPGALVALSLLLDAMCEVDPTAAEARLEALDAYADRCGVYWSGA